MKFQINLPRKLKPHFRTAIARYTITYSDGDLERAWHYLERAHIIGQRYPLAHTYVHFKMLQFGIKIKNRNEILGQLPRLLTGGVKSFVGKVPLGNPGGSNVHPLKPFPLDKELRAIFEKAGVQMS